VKLPNWIRAPFAWNVVRRDDDGYACLENVVTRQRRCRWDGSAWSNIDCTFMRTGDVSYGPFGREVYGRLNGFDRFGVRIGGAQLVQHN
jgi:hypothetical protein